MTATPRARLGWLVLLAVVGALALHRVSPGDVAAPPWRSWAELERWYEDLGPSAAVVALVRLVAIAGCGWLAVASALQIVAVIAPGRGVRSLADGLSPRFLRSVACGAASLSVTAGFAMPTAALGPQGNPPGTAVMVPLDATTTSALPPPSSSTTTRVVPVTTTVPATPPAPPAPVVPAAPTRVSPPPPSEVVVVPGDSFWSIAVDEADGRDVTTYWQALIEANRDRLVDRSNPDLLYPDQVLRLP